MLEGLADCTAQCGVEVLADELRHHAGNGGVDDRSELRYDRAFQVIEVFWGESWATLDCGAGTFSAELYFLNLAFELLGEVG